MSRPIRIAVAGAGAFGIKHLDALSHIDGAEVVSLVGRRHEPTLTVASRYNIAHVTTDLNESLALPDVEAVILCTPTQLHASQAIACMKAGKHVEIEIPLADSLADAEAVVAAQEASALVAMVGHTRRFNPSHQWIHARIAREAFHLQNLEVQTHFLRRSNINAAGNPRSWTDHLLWHHAAHSVDLFTFQAGAAVVEAHAVQGPLHPELGIAMDMAIQLKAANGAICSISLSFNNDGPLGSFFRYIGDTGTYIARYDELVTGHDDGVDLSGIAISMNGIELQDRAFLAAIRDGREPEASVASVLPCYQLLHQLERKLTTG